MLDGVAPTGEVFVEEELVGQVQTAVVGQDGKQIRRAEEAGGEMVVELADAADEAGQGGRAEVAREQAELEGQDVAGLGRAGEPAGGGDELVVELGGRRRGRE